MRVRRTGISCLVLAAGIAAASIALTDSATAACPGTWTPVCGTKPDGPRTFDNACAAKAAGARIVHLGECQPILCSGMWPKVALYLHVVPSTPTCGIDPLTHNMMTYPNSCAAEYAGATWVHNGPCRGGRG
jgi:hypothetical protein